MDLFIIVFVMAHNHSHHHHHHISAEHASSPSTMKVFSACIALNLLFVFVEAAVGFACDSLGLLSDAGHNLGDVFTLVLSLLAIKMASLHGNRHFTYGYKKSTVLVSLVNAVILLVAVGAIIIESVYKLRNPEPVNGVAVSWTAAAGIVVNGVTAWLLMKESGDDINIRGAFLHMAMDTLVSIGVVVSGLVMLYTGFYMVDAIISLVIAAVILFSTWSLLRESFFLTMDAVPASVSMDSIEKELSEVPGVKGWHHLHIWAVSTTENAATLHVEIGDPVDMETVKHGLKKCMRKNGVQHCTVECELPGCNCCEQECN